MCQQNPACTYVNQPSQSCSQIWLKENAWVRVKELPEIERTLDSNGRKDGLPFMPEMVEFCGKTLRIRRLADRVCLGGFRKHEGIGHLENARCTGAAHGGCQAACLLFWDESWLEPALGAGLQCSGTAFSGSTTSVDLRPCFDATTQRYSCQLTEVPKLGTPIPVPGMWEYLCNYASGQLSHSKFKFLVKWFSDRVLMAILRRLRWIPSRVDSTTREFNIGDLVRVRSRAEILRTLDRSAAHKGLKVTADMLRYCGKTVRITSRVNRIVDEYSGQLKILKNDCYILDGVTCAGGGLLCSREELYYWRGIWLEKIAAEIEAESNEREYEDLPE